ncbi:MAG TPA: hypothetical protein VNT31_09915 [Nocardioides sp.]|nr:hypothetical protein [Nocardioides sp.]
MSHVRRTTRSFGESVERGLHLSIGMVIVVKTVVFASQFAVTDHADRRELGFVAVIVLLVGTTAVRCLRGGPTGLDVLLCTAALVVDALMPRPEVPLSGTALSPVIHLVEPMLVLIAVRRRGSAVPMLLIAALFVALRWATGGDDGLWFGVQEAVLITGTALGALFLVTQMRRASARAEDVISRHHDSHAEQMSSAEVETAAFVHDDLVPTLLALGVVPHEPDTRVAAGLALARITAPGAGEDGTDVVEALRAAAVREVLDLELVVRGPRTHVPEAVREAMVGAATEALRNVARHSGQRRATVTVVRRPGALRIRVEDRGEGLDGPPGVGLRVAIVGRVEAIGGTARIVGVPGSGTRVELAWRTHLVARALGMSPDLDSLIRAAVTDPGRVARLACAVLAAGYLATAALLTVDIPLQPWSYAGAAAIAIYVGLVTAAMSRGPLSPLVLAVTAVVPAEVLAVALPSVSPEGMGGTESWLIEFSGLPALAIAWVVSVRMVLLVLLPNAVVIAVVALQLGSTANDLPHLLFVQPVSALFVAVIGRVCRRAGRVMTTPSATERTTRTQAIRHLLGATRLPVVAALRAALSGDASAHAPRLLASAVRDCLYLPGPAHADLRAELDALRRSGVRVDTILTEPPPASRTLAAALSSLRGSAAEQVTVSGTGDETMVVVLHGSAPARAPRMLPLSWQASLEPEAVVLTGPPDLATLIRRGDRRRVPD